MNEVALPARREAPSEVSELANILGIDLDSAEIRLAELQPSLGGMVLHAALALPTGPVDAATLGQQLKGRLKEVGFKATQAVVALGADSLMCREVRHPDIPGEELPAIVQYQVVKESSLPADDVVVDYIQLKDPLPTGERRSLSYVVRKARVKFCEEMCEAAGLRLHSIIPRSVALLAGATQPRSEAALKTIALASSDTLLVLHQGEMVFTRSLGAPQSPEELLAELRRSLAGYEMQPNMPALAGLYLALHDLPANFEQVAGQLRVPVTLYDPYTGIQEASRLAGQGDYAVACGAAESYKFFRKAPVDFLNPKRVVQKPNRKRTYGIIGGAAAAALVALIGGGYWLLTSSSDSEIALVQDRIKELRKQEESYGDVEKQFTAINTWANQDCIILDEIYDLIAAFPDVGGLQIVKADWSPMSLLQSGPAGTTPQLVTKLGKTPAPTTPVKAPTVKPIATLIIEATSEEPERQFPELKAALGRGKHWKLVKFDVVPGDRNRAHAELSVMPTKPGEYSSLLTIGQYTTTKGEGQLNPGTRRRPRVLAPGGRP